MYKTQRILISLLSLAIFTSCTLDSLEKKRADLHSKKERLIDEISSDFVAINVASIEGTGIDPEILTKAIKLGLSGICGVLERKELVAVDEDFLSSISADEVMGLDMSPKDMESRAMLLGFLRGELKLGKKEIREFFSLNPGDVPMALIELVDKMHCLTQVMKEIRELT